MKNLITATEVETTPEEDAAVEEVTENGAGLKVQTVEGSVSIVRTTQRERILMQHC